MTSLGCANRCDQHVSTGWLKAPAGTLTFWQLAFISGLISGFGQAFHQAPSQVRLDAPAALLKGKGVKWRVRTR
ncbi:hypothetical protein T02_4152 [Trichinella nativa]|uniref:Uncharacterized protein n=1 Tax=Trichinella nativa TaxID=6335 RepID=A0A0V1L8C8_9BILA|nr:hypothetical protein T06_2712 [Trichinella sp. T6]KRZ55812.1 hypothetical protein T02_4152 [Trichinella nativa]